MIGPRRRVTSVLVFVVVGGCSGSGDQHGIVDAPGVPDAPATDPYAYRPPPSALPPVGLDPETWKSHWIDDLAPYWTMDEAKGTPLGNFPTYRGMDGKLSGSSARKPRMLGRQILTYSVGYLLTGEVVSSIGRTGAWVYPWPDSDTAKCNEWKNGFHTSEHALVMSLLSSWLGGAPAALYYAFPAAEVAARAADARPYTFLGHVAQVEDLGPLTSDPSRHKVRVSFDELR